MSISLSVNMSGDFDNQRHQEVAKEITDAINEVLQRQPDMAYVPNIWATETKTPYRYRKAFSDSEFVESGGTHTITFSTGFHINNK